MRKMMKRLKNEKGLTLVELLAVVVILAIVAAIAFVMIGNVMENSKKDAAVADALQVISAAKLYETINTDGISDAGVTVEKLQDADDGYLETLHDPWGGVFSPSVSDKVTIDNNDNYHVVLGFDKCSISHTEEQLIQEGRNVCKGDVDPE